MKIETQESADRVVGILRQLVSESDELLKATVGELTEEGREARNALHATLERCKAAYRNLQARAVAGAETTDRVIRGNPYKSAGIAFGIGVLLGVLVNRNK
jgi:ElaB/YqjD/DUF883 family membrane-anchored ribosome-binding protein